MSNHLIVGLGGTGGKIICAFKKTLFQECRHELPPSIKLEYLYVDSDPELMDLDSPKWKILGQSVQLSATQQLCIQGQADLAQVIVNRNNYPGIRDWIGDQNQWNNILGGVLANREAEQKRRLGRFLFSQQIQNFVQRINTQVRQLQHQSAQNAVTFHICAGLAGGTGSGTIVDAVAQIRQQYPNEEEFRIILYLLLPETQPLPRWDAGNYHANGYAALMELNALSVGVWKPHDISGARERVQINNPFSCCYLYFNENENGAHIRIEEDVPSLLANFLYQKLTVAQNWAALQARIESAQNFNAQAEANPDTHILERSKGFLTFGIKRLVVPEEEIREYMTYAFATQALRQMLYNHWSDNEGFTNYPRNQGYREEVRERDNWQRWLITDDHLCLSTAILSDEKKKGWSSIRDYWDLVTNDAINDVKDAPIFTRQNNVIVATRLTELERLFTDAFNKGFRRNNGRNEPGMGVNDFYEAKTNDRPEHIREIRSVIERQLFTQWREGNSSIDETSRKITALLEVLRERYNAIDAEITHLKASEENATDKLDKNKIEWAKIGILYIDKPDKLLNAHAINLKSKYISLTYIKAWEFAQALLSSLIEEINRLSNEIGSCFATIKNAADSVQAEMNVRCNHNQNLDLTTLDLNEAVVLFYHPDRVKAFTRDLLRDKRNQLIYASSLRSALIELLATDQNQALFAKFKAEEITKILDSIVTNADLQVENAHARAAQGNIAPQFGVNIIEKLASEYSGNQHGLNVGLSGLVRSAGNYLKFDTTEKQNQAPGATPNIQATDRAIILPTIAAQNTQYQGFSANLQALLQGHWANSQVITNGNEKEIVLISVNSLFPLRFVEQVKFLKQKYIERTTGVNAAQFLLELHCEGDGTNLPSLFLMTNAELQQQRINRQLREQASAWLLLAFNLDIIEKNTNGQTGKTEFRFILRRNGSTYITENHLLGNSIKEVITSSNLNLGLDVIVKIKDAVNNKLNAEYRHIDKQTELKDKITRCVQDIQMTCNNDVSHPDFLCANEAGLQAENIVDAII